MSSLKSKLFSIFASNSQVPGASSRGMHGGSGPSTLKRPASASAYDDFVVLSGHLCTIVIFTD
eukprot:CAMPEP_0197709442 /NCGR_PEP_ID=MMETSP1338-20131121/128458_1 /TAXON_ID=43686 ORGANISM="Pelagodinium beii, Strain RCC1491" /NCGR_SAMPLE_ID=MMETSP1338 /ASSEMBLY_ACC=CAM_ASM_000754 /LENGTH=62 /DNA_ID=CAMNT_0043293377 /DNA_START=750 /DNA_END=935 /DNA_ORIENTATION=-